MTSGATPHSGRTVVYAVTSLLFCALAAFAVPYILTVYFGHVIFETQFNSILEYSVFGGLLLGGVTGFIMDIVMEHLQKISGEWGFRRIKRTEMIAMIGINAASIIGFIILFSQMGDFHFPRA